MREFSPDGSEQLRLFEIDARDVAVNGLADVIYLRDQFFEETAELPPNVIPLFRVRSTPPKGAA